MELEYLPVSSIEKNKTCKTNEV